MNWLNEVSINVASAIITAGIIVAVVGQLKAFRINALLAEIDTTLERMLNGLKGMNEFASSAEVDEAKKRILTIQDEAINDSSRGFRLSRLLLRELEEIKEEIAALDEERLAKVVLDLLYGDHDASKFLGALMHLRARIERLRAKLFFASFFMP